MTRSVLVDLFKALASQLIVLHHLCVYTPMANWVAQAWPALYKFIAEDGRLAVQPFLVMGGFLTAQALHRRRDYPLLELVLQRYLRLAPQLGCALILVMAATVLVGRELAQESWVSPLPSLTVLLAHLFFLQDVLGLPSLLAGAWYVAIDLQLFTLFAALLFALRKLPRATMDAVVPVLLAVLTLASLLVFSWQPRLEKWAIYFFWAYGLGALAAWSANSQKAKWLWRMVAVLVLVNWLLAPRDQPPWALATALALQVWGRWSWGSQTGLCGRVICRLSAWSYGLFVCHFAVIVLVSGLWVRFELSGLPAALMAFLLVMASSAGLGALVQAVSDRLVLRWNPWGAWQRLSGRPA